jgi:carbamoyltransferase
MSVRIVGFNLSHDSSACLVENGAVRVALALERTTRIKRGTVPLHAYAAAMADLTNQILTEAGLVSSDIDHWIATSTESRDAEDEARLAGALGLVAPRERCLRLPHPGHHLAHASAAFHTSGFDEAVALVIDAYGSLIGSARERETAFLFRAGCHPTCVWRAMRDDHRIAGRWRDGGIWVPERLAGIGEIYRVVTLALGFHESGTTYDDAGKTMGLAPYGKRLSKDNLFITVSTDGDLCFDRAADSLVELGLAVCCEGGLRLVPRPATAPFQPFHCNLAAQLQDEFEEACLHVIRDVLRRVGTRSLVLSGGCFLNSTLNNRIVREAGVDRVFIFPAATDDGNAVGAALYAYHHLTGQETTATPALEHVFLGPTRLSDRDVPALAEAWRLSWHRHAGPAEIANAAAAAIADGEIVGWFQDRSEFGPRSLGSRSILCHPGIAGMKDRLNARVKFRESFRPFAGSVLADHAGRWFDMPLPDSPFMLLVCPVVPGKRLLISEIVHVDGTCRVQTVDEHAPERFRALIEAFERRTGLPVVLNTSFNLRGMPIVETVEDAFDCLYGSRLDRLFIGDVEVPAPDLATLCPVRVAAPAGSDGASTASRIVELASGVRSVRDIAAEIEVAVDETVDLVLDLRRRRQIRWAGLPEATGPVFPLPQYSPTSVD